MFNDLDDPRKQAMLAMAFGLLGGQGGKGAGGFARDLGQAGLLGLNRFAVANEDKRRSGLAEDQRKMQQFQFDQAKRGAEDQDFARQIAPNYFSPQVSPLTPNDDEGNPMPSSPAKADFMGYGQAMASRNPQMGAQFMAMAPKPERPKWAIAPNGQPVDMNNLDPTKNFAPTPDWKDPAYQAFKKDVARSGAPSVSVGGPVMEKTEHQEKAKLNAKAFDEVQTLARGARKENSLLDAMMRNSVETGAATPITTTGKAWLASFGIGGPKLNEAVANAQAFKAASMEMVLNRQMLQKGPQTESDAKRLEATVASLGNAPDANRAIMAFAKEQNNRFIREAQFRDKWWREKKTFEGADEAWDAGEGGTSLWDSPELKKYQGAKVVDFNSLPPR